MNRQKIFFSENGLKRFKTYLKSVKIVPDFKINNPLQILVSNTFWFRPDMWPTSNSVVQTWAGAKHLDDDALANKRIRKSKESLCF